MNEISIIKHVNGLSFVPDEDLNKSGRNIVQFNKIKIYECPLTCFIIFIRF